MARVARGSQMFKQGWMTQRLNKIEEELRELPQWMKKEAGLEHLKKDSAAGASLPTNPFEETRVEDQQSAPQ